MSDTINIFVYLSKPSLFNNLIEVIIWGTKLDVDPYFQSRSIFKITVNWKLRTISSLSPTPHFFFFLPDGKINSGLFSLCLLAQNFHCNIEARQVMGAFLPTGLSAKLP